MIRIFIPIVFIVLANVILIPYRYIFRPRWISEVENEWLLIILYSFPNFFTAYCLSFLFLLTKRTSEVKTIYINTWVIVILTFYEYTQPSVDWKDIMATFIGTFLAVPLIHKFKQRYCQHDS